MIEKFFDSWFMYNLILSPYRSMYDFHLRKMCLDVRGHCCQHLFYYVGMLAVLKTFFDCAENLQLGHTVVCHYYTQATGSCSVDRW
jgi:hypothetical protein